MIMLLEISGEKVLRKSFYCKPQLGFWGARENCGVAGGIPPPLTAVSALAGGQAEQMIHKPHICFNNACEEPL